MFGEIGLLTSLRRTCTIITTDCCLMMALSNEGLKNIKGEFPSIFNSISNNMYKYIDRDTCERIRFIQNIPLFRFLTND